MIFLVWPSQKGSAILQAIRIVTGYCIAACMIVEDTVHRGEVQAMIRSVHICSIRFAYFLEGWTCRPPFHEPEFHYGPSNWQMSVRASLPATSHPCHCHRKLDNVVRTTDHTSPYIKDA